MAKEITTEQIEMLEEMVARARKAAAIIETYDQDRVDHLCQAVAAALYDLKGLGRSSAMRPWMRPLGR